MTKEDERKLIDYNILKDDEESIRTHKGIVAWVNTLTFLSKEARTRLTNLLREKEEKQT